MFTLNDGKLKYDKAHFLNLLITVVLIVASVVAIHYKAVGSLRTDIEINRAKIVEMQKQLDRYEQRAYELLLKERIP